MVQPHPAGAQGSWSGIVTTISPVGEYALYPQVAVDPQGNAIAVWFLFDIGIPGTRPVVRAAHYAAATGTWGSPVDLSTPAAGQGAFFPQIAMDSVGNATVVWYRSIDDTHPGVIQTAHFAAATGAWRSGSDLSTEGIYPRVAMDAGGNATAVWQELATRRIRAARYARVTETWGNATTLTTGSSTSTSIDAPSDPQLAVDAGGNVMVVWGRYTSISSVGTTTIQAARYSVVNGTWSGVSTISAVDCSGCAYPEVAMDPDGNAMAVWSDRKLPYAVIQAARYTPAAGTWATPVDVSPALIDEDTDVFPQIAADAGGNFTAVWSGVEYRAMAARYSAATGTWGAATGINPIRSTVLRPRVTVDTFGNATAVWHVRPVTGETIQAARYSAATGTWSDITNLRCQYRHRRTRSRGGCGRQCHRSVVSEAG